MNWLNRIRKKLSDLLEPAPPPTHHTHTAYAEVMHNEDDTWIGRIYSYAGQAEVLEEYTGAGGRAAATKETQRRMRKYRKEGT